MNLKEAVKAMAVKDLRESRGDLVIFDALPMREAIELLTRGIKSLGLDEETTSKLIGVLSAPAERDLVTESLTALVESLDSIDGLSDEAKGSLAKVITEAASELAVEITIPEVETTEASVEESTEEEVAKIEESKEDDEVEKIEESEEEAEEPVDAVQMVRAQRALDSSLREGNLPDAVEDDIRKTVESEIDAEPGKMSAAAVVERVTELVSQSKRAAESWTPEAIKGHGETGVDDDDEGVKESDPKSDPKRDAEDSFFK